MARAITQLDEWKKSYSQLVKINQRLRYVSSGYYMDYDGTIYMKSLVPFLEKLITLHEPEKVEDFFGTMVMPNAFFIFSKNAKKTKLTIQKEEENHQFLFGQEDNDEWKYELNIVNPVHDITYASHNIIDKMYKRFFITQESEPGFTQYPDSDNYEELPDDIVKKLQKSEAVYYECNGTTLTFTKHLFLDIKKDDHLSIARMGYEEIENNQYRVYYRMKHITELYTDITLFNALQKRET